jgi:hypothetical protein
MRRPAQTALALCLTAIAALVLNVGAAFGASGDRVVTFTREAAETQSSERTWFVVTGRTTFEDDEAEEIEIPELPSSLPRDSFGRLQLLHSAGLALEASTLEEALRELELPFMFAGVEQWRVNLTTPDGAAADPRLWNVGMESPLHDENSMRVLLGRAAWAASERGTMADDVAHWQSLVPAWAEDVRATLAKQGIPFSVELLASPGIELLDTAKPLFSKGAHPPSLFGLGVMQAGEGAFLRSMGADELMREVWPMYYRYYHRAAGAAAPAELAGGLTFGVVQTEACAEKTANGCINGVRYVPSPMQRTSAYMRWLAYGQPGSSEGALNGVVTDPTIGVGYNPLTGALVNVGGGSGYKNMWLDLIVKGIIKPDHFITPWNDVVTGGLNSIVASAGVLQDPSIWFAGQYAPYAPQNLAPEVLARYAVLVSGT